MRRPIEGEERFLQMRHPWVAALKAYEADLPERHREEFLGLCFALKQRALDGRHLSSEQRDYATSWLLQLGYLEFVFHCKRNEGVEVGQAPDYRSIVWHPPPLIETPIPELDAVEAIAKQLSLPTLREVAEQARTSLNEMYNALRRSTAWTQAIKDAHAAGLATLERVHEERGLPLENPWSEDS